MDNKDLIQTINDIVKFCTSEATKNRYGLLMTGNFYPREQKWDPKLSNFDDFGDITVFIAWAGSLLHKKEWLDFATDQFKKWQKFGLTQYGFYKNIDLDKSNESDHLFSVGSVYDLQDAILGMFEMWYLTSNNVYKIEFERLLELINKIRIRNFGWIPNKVWQATLLGLPHTTANPAVAGLIAEHASLYGKTINSLEYKRLAKLIVEPWLKTRDWESKRLLPQGRHTLLPFVSPYRSTKFMKEHSNVIYALLANSQERDNLRIAEHMLKNMTSCKNRLGMYHTQFDMLSGKIVKGVSCDKTQNFTLIDTLVSVYENTNKKIYLKEAIQLSDAWLSIKDKTTALIPEYVNHEGDVTNYISKLDQSFDLYSSFLRLYMVTKDTRWLNEAMIGGEVMEKYFKDGLWWHRIIHSKSGKPASYSEVPDKDRPSSVNFTKYVGGALRFYSMLYAIQTGVDTNQIKLMSRDR